MAHHTPRPRGTQPQCLYWPLKFSVALPLQLAYVGSAISIMRPVKCVLQAPKVAAGAATLCRRVQGVMNGLAVLLTELCLPLGEEAAASACDARSGELVLYFWLLGFGMLLPLYVLYVNELVRKRSFLQQWQQQQEAAAAGGQQQQQGSVDGPSRLWCTGLVLQLSTAVHVAAVIVLLTLALAVAEAMVGAMPPPECPESF